MNCQSRPGLWHLLRGTQEGPFKHRKEAQALGLYAEWISQTIKCYNCCQKHCEEANLMSSELTIQNNCRYVSMLWEWGGPASGTLLSSTHITGQKQHRMSPS